MKFKDYYQSTINESGMNRLYHEIADAVDQFVKQLPESEFIKRKAQDIATEIAKQTETPFTSIHPTVLRIMKQSLKSSRLVTEATDKQVLNSRALNVIKMWKQRIDKHDDHNEEHESGFVSALETTSAQLQTIVSKVPERAKYNELIAKWKNRANASKGIDDQYHQGLSKGLVYAADMLTVSLDR